MATSKADITGIPQPFQDMAGQIKANTSHSIRKSDIVIVVLSPSPPFFSQLTMWQRIMA
jgi:hypothetical protein